MVMDPKITKDKSWRGGYYKSVLIKKVGHDFMLSLSRSFQDLLVMQISHKLTKGKLER